MRHCPHWSCRLRKLGEAERRDDPVQQFVFELKCDNLPAQSPLYILASARRFAKAAYDRLDPARQSAFDEIVADYEKRGWWVRCSEEDLKSAKEHILDPAVVFMVPGGEKRKDRLVVDLRKANKRFDKGSGSATTVSLCIATARLYGSGVCWVFDAAKAFYKLRWVGLMAVLLVKNLIFYSMRCIFGVTTGPGSLRHTLGALVDEFRKILRVTMLMMCFADDVFCGSIEGAIAVCSLIWLLTMCGLAITQRKFQCMALRQCRERVSKQLDAASLPRDLFKWSDSVELLGCSLSFDTLNAQPLLVASCNRQDRLKAAGAQASHLLDALRSGTISGDISKGYIFSLGGNLSYDCMGCHAIDRVVADALRSWFARIYASDDWAVPCDLSKLDELGRATGILLAEWAIELAQQSSPCQHTTPVREAKDPIRLEVASDASTTGAGYTISIVDVSRGEENSQRFLLSSGAWRFTSQQRHYHSNRRELAACCKAVQAAVDIVSHFGESCAGPLPKLEFIICSDNRPTVSWLQGRGSISRSSLERRAVIRTLNALKDEIDHLKTITQGSVTVKHIAGQDNLLPDELSRVFDRVISLPSGRRLSVADALHGDPDDVANCPDLFAEPEGLAMGVNWLITSEEWSGGVDVEGEVDVFSILAAFPTEDRMRGYSCLVDKNEEKRGSILQTLCGDNWDIQSVLADFLFLRRVLQALRPEGKGKTEEELEDANDYSFVRALQDGMAVPPIRPSGPYIFDEQNGIYLFRNGCPDGGYVLLPVVPHEGAHCMAFRSKLLFDAHRACRHGSVGSTVGNIYDKFFVSNIRAEARRFVRSCFPCQLLRARRSWDQLPGGGPDRNEATKWEPYREVFIDILSLGDIRGYKGSTKVLTVYCLYTFHSCWVPVGDSMKDILSALARVQTEQGGLSVIWSDQASYFRSSRFSDDLWRGLGARIKLLPVRSPWKSGGGERMHGLGLRVAKTILRSQTGYVGRRRSRQKSSIDLEEICREVTFLLNTRPLDFSNTNEPSGECMIITPDLLAKGFTRKRGCLLPSPSSSISISRRIKAARTYFLTDMFRNMRLSVAKSMGFASSRGRVLEVHVGDPILIHHPEKKLSPGFRLAHVVEVLKEGRLIRARFTDGSEADQHHFNVVKLLHNPELSQQRGRVMD
ncbi:hypothetical protein Pmar_PMAR015368 [Perkinsus marinus ATCC 50983]|uniref:Integrase zinc-binding domain-containing protein n=1 Tax=Perkinsus marinus (strain ATCC 50983 / TXsc) TaxID=423536 RepID=C5LGW4_PERM5|nr:hypothetical protein Pmar_PMAR015368 [Perkinsus marinus ATCC 50983]EER04031.1 hypothetical protein Pmar_PMAR015368 [Perkinsus marinus ATCC 50983]|eukprot:XP_002772215.1 hypothetical protein Pmar_PMAR015368 [Perkinsus marinus ATCC 50983]